MSARVVKWSQLTHRESVVQPAAEMEVARLVVEGEEGDVDLAGGAELGGRRPEHVAGVVDHGQAAHVLAGEVVGAESVNKGEVFRGVSFPL